MKTLLEMAQQLSVLVKEGDREPIMAHLAKMYEVYGNDALQYMVASSLDTGRPDEALLLAAAALAIDPNQVPLIQFIGSKLREYGWDFLAEEIRRVESDRFRHCFGVNPDEMQCGTGSIGADGV